MPGLWQLRPFQRHSLVLTLGALVYICFGVVFAETSPTGSRAANLVLLEPFPRELVGSVWIAVGFAVLISGRWPPAHKTWGYTVLSGHAGAWASVYLAGIVVADAPTSGWSAVFVWFLVAVLWWAIAGLVNPDDLVKPGRRVDDDQ